MKLNINPFRLINLIFVLVFISCDKSEFPNLEYSRLETRAPEIIAQGGVRFSAKILSLADDTITDHGFVWTRLLEPQININSAEKISLGKLNGGNYFEALVDTGFFQGETYTVRAFLQSKKFTFLGNALSFVSLGSKEPATQNILPADGTLGDNYGLAATLPKVLFNAYIPKVVDKIQTESQCILLNNLIQNHAEISLNAFGN